MTTESGGIDESKIGGNASVEASADALDEASVRGCDIVLANRLSETFFAGKKDYQLYAKVYPVL